MSQFDLPDECNLTLPRRCPRHPMYTEIYCPSCEEEEKKFYNSIQETIYNIICIKCGHNFAAHQGHTHMVGTPEPTYCSQGCGCLEFKAPTSFAPIEIQKN